MQIYGFYLHCRDGGAGWGETGDKAYMERHANDEESAITSCNRHIPGGWDMVSLGVVGNKNLYLRHLT